MNLLIFFALPIATILLAIVLERVLRSPILVAITFFSIYLIVLFVLFATGAVTDLATLLIALIVYTFLAYITAVIVRFIRCICQRYLRPCCSICPNSEEDVGDVIDNENDCNCGCDSNNLQNANDKIALSGNIIPNQTNNGRTGIVRGCYRRY